MCISTARARTNSWPRGSWEVFVPIFCQIGSNRSRPFHDDFVFFLSRGSGMKSSGDPYDMLSKALAWSCTIPLEKFWTLFVESVFTWSGTGPCEKILWKFCWDLQEVLAGRSWRSSALVFVWKLFWNPHKAFYEGLWAPHMVVLLHLRPCLTSPAAVP